MNGRTGLDWRRCFRSARPYHAARPLELGEHFHAVVSANCAFDSAACPSLFELADGEAVLRDVVHADVDRPAG